MSILLFRRILLYLAVSTYNITHSFKMKEISFLSDQAVGGSDMHVHCKINRG